MNKVNLIDNNINQINKYINILLKWNKSFNLTAAKDYDDIFNNHILDCAFLADYLHNKENKGDHWIDIGTGAGFPGIILAIIFKEQKISLLDSNTKKIQFITYIKQQLKLDNINIIYNRVENIRNINFDIIISRAFSNITNFLNITNHLINDNTKWITFKRDNYQSELNDLINNNNSFKLKDNIKYHVNNKTNHLLVFQKNI